MKKYLFILLLFCLTLFSSRAQITVYTSDDNEEYPVYEVEEMFPEEIKSYNSFIKQGMPERTALLYINAGRAQDNLIYAPATIIDYDFKPEITEEDSIPDAMGAVGVWVKLINTTPKIIKEITEPNINGIVKIKRIVTAYIGCLTIPYKPVSITF